MTSLVVSYYSVNPLAIFTHQKVDQILKAFAYDKGYLVYGRIKTYESLLDKMQSGRYKSLDEVDDLVAFSIIIDTRNQEREVVAYLNKVFRITNIRQNSAIREESQFVFDCTRCYARLPIAADVPVDNAMLFEVQIRTILQHAWSKITHPEVYKASRLSSKKARLSAEMLAQIEALDRTFATFSTSSRGVKRIVRSSLEKSNAILAMFERLIQLKHISEEFGPKNNKRLADNILTMVGKKDDSSILRITQVIEKFVINSTERVPTSISLFEIALVALHKEGLIKGGGRSFYISEELASFYPTIASLMPRVKY